MPQLIRQTVKTVFVALLMQVITPSGQGWAATATYVPQAPGGGIFRYRIMTDPLSLDWNRGDLPTAIVQNTMRGLYKANESGEIVPDLADKIEVLEDGKLWRFRVRGDLRWSDGVLLNAAHFVESLRRVMNPKFASSYGFLLTDVQSTKLISELEFEIRLKQPGAYLPAILSHPSTYPIRPDLIAKWPDYGSNPRHMAFLGVFQIYEWESQIRVILTPNPHTEIQPWLNRIEAWIVPSHRAAVRLFKRGHLEWIPDTAPIPPFELKEVAHIPQQAMNSPSVVFVALSGSPALLEKPQVARALSLALDRTRIPKLTRVNHRPAQGFCPPEVWRALGTGPSDDAFALGPVEGDSKKARELFSEAGFEPGSDDLPELTLQYFDRPGIWELAEWLQGEWETVLGLSVHLEALDPREYWTRIARKPAPLLMNLKSATYLDPDSFFRILTTGHPQNFERWSDAEYDEAIAESRRTLSSRGRSKLYQVALRRALIEKPAIIPLYFRSIPMLIQPYVLGLKELGPNLLLTTISYAPRTYPSPRPIPKPKPQDGPNPNSNLE